MLLLTLKGQILYKILFFRIWIRNQNFSIVVTGTAVNRYGSTTLEHCDCKVRYLALHFSKRNKINPFLLTETRERPIVVLCTCSKYSHLLLSCEHPGTVHLKRIFYVE